MSARAAWRLETLGFRTVHRYTGGLDDWLVARRPLAGRSAATPRVADLARADVPTCAPDDRVGDVARLVQEGGWPLAVVVNERRVVLGRLRAADLEASSDALAAELMRDGPRTIRGAGRASELPAWLDERSLPGVLVTSADGELVGYVRRDEL